MFESIFHDGTVATAGFFLVIAVSLLAGIVYSALACYRTKSSDSFAIASALLPMAVAVVITLVNGNLGVGVAIAGAFGLVRFRSAPGTAKEIAVIFIGMAGGLAFGMGYLAYGAVFLLLSGVLLRLSEKFRILTERKRKLEKNIKITIPEDLDYTTVFDDIFAEFTTSAELEKIKSANMGSMFRLTYRVTLRKAEDEKPMIDAIRTRNGNLEILSSRADLSDNEL